MVDFTFRKAYKLVKNKVFFLNTHELTIKNSTHKKLLVVVNWFRLIPKKMYSI